MFGVLESEPGMVGANAMLNVLFLCQIYIYIYFFFCTTTRKARYVRVYTVASALTVTGWFFYAEIQIIFGTVFLQELQCLFIVSYCKVYKNTPKEKKGHMCLHVRIALTTVL